MRYGVRVASRSRVILSRRNRGGGWVGGAVKDDEGSSAKDCSISSQPLSAESLRVVVILSRRRRGGGRLGGSGKGRRRTPCRSCHPYRCRNPGRVVGRRGGGRRRTPRANPSLLCERVNVCDTRKA